MTYFLIRKAIHFLFGMIAVLLLYALPQLSPYLFALAAVLFVIFDLWRRLEGQWKKRFHRIFGKLLKASEGKGRITGATTFMLTVAGLSFSFPTKIVITSVLIISISDSLASVAGKLLPMRRIWKEKSLGGSAAFLLSAMTVYHFFLPASFISILFAALLLTLIELFSPEAPENILVGFGAAVILVLIADW